MLVVLGVLVVLAGLRSREVVEALTAGAVLLVGLGMVSLLMSATGGPDVTVGLLG